MKSKKRILVPIMVLALVVATIGGTLAWLKATSGPVENTFTVGNVNVALDESNNLDLKMIPGKTITKDPMVSVRAGSEDSYVFVKVEKSANFDEFMTYEVANGWMPLDVVPGVYYREYTGEAGMEWPVIKDNHVMVKDSVTNEMMNGLTEDTYPTLTFTAYAVQKEGMTNAADAWAKAAF